MELLDFAVIDGEELAIGGAEGADGGDFGLAASAIEEVTGDEETQGMGAIGEAGEIDAEVSRGALRVGDENAVDGNVDRADLAVVEGLDEELGILAELAGGDEEGETVARVKGEAGEAAGEAPQNLEIFISMPLASSKTRNTADIFYIYSTIPENYHGIPAAAKNQFWQHLTLTG